MGQQALPNYHEVLVRRVTPFRGNVENWSKRPGELELTIGIMGSRGNWKLMPISLGGLRLVLSPRTPTLVKHRLHLNSPSNQGIKISTIDRDGARTSSRHGRFALLSLSPRQQNGKMKI